ncbi:MAG: DNA repair exonuclease, partial [Roseiarcus sp.]
PSSDPVAELRALMEREVAQSKAFQDELREMAEELRGHLPPGSREDLFGRDAAEFAQTLGEVASDGAEEVLAFLRAGDKDRAP